VSAHGIDADQVAGGCFCCRFSDLIDAAEHLRAHAPDVIFAEAVGSCTDISATTLQPLKLHHADQFRVAAYTVLVDPQRARDLSAANAPADLAFLFDRQIEEADLLCFSKADLNAEFPPLRGAPVRYLSAITGQGVAGWLDEILAEGVPSGDRILEIDYERYARAEAALAWLNCRVTVRLAVPLAPAQLIGPLLEHFDRAFTSAGFVIAHLKLTGDSPSGFLKASLVRNGGEPSVHGMFDASPTETYELLVNVRAAGDPGLLEAIVRAAIEDLGQVEWTTMQCFRPAPPTPQYRIASVVNI
jgi:hypothetical protein